MVFSPSNGDWNLADDGEVGGGWTGQLLFDPGALLAENELPDLANKVRVNLDNRLRAVSESGTVSFVDKKDADGLSVVAVVPEPGSSGLLALGLAVLAAGTRRR